LTAFETVKAFNAEAFETARYSAAVAEYQRLTKEQGGLYSLLNVTQSAIIRVAVAAVMILSAHDVLSGRMTAGGFVSLLSYVQQIFGPLSWLGGMYTMIMQVRLCRCAPRPPRHCYRRTLDCL